MRFHEGPIGFVLPSVLGFIKNLGALQSSLYEDVRNPLAALQSLSVLGFTKHLGLHKAPSV